MGHYRRLAFIFLILHMVIESRAQRTGCKHFAELLVCQSRLPRLDEVTESVEGIVVADIPDGQWLSISDWENKDARVHQIEFRRVCIDRMDPGYFATTAGLNKLRKLLLRPVCGKAKFDSDALQGLSNSLNQLVVVGEVFVDLEAVSKLQSLSELELRNTITSQMPDNFFQSLRALTSIELANVSLTALPWNSVAQWLKEDKIRSLHLVDFPLHCDCEASKTRKLPTGPFPTALEDLKCASPENMKGMLLRDIPEEKLCPMDRSADSLDQTSGNDSVSVPVAGGEAGSTSIRMEVIIAAAVVGVVVLCFVLFIIIYKVRMSSKNKRQRQQAEAGGTRHQSTKYCAVIETPNETFSNNLNGNKGDHTRHSGGQPV